MGPKTVVTALIKQAKKLPSELYKLLGTWTGARNLRDHPRFTLTTSIDVYFCDLQSPWQRGSSLHPLSLISGGFSKFLC